MIEIFNPNELDKLYKSPLDSSKGQNGQVTIIGGSKLFHGAPLLALTVASRTADMVFFASPEPSVGEVASEIKSKLLSFIWIPWDEADSYINKSDAVLIGNGMMRYSKEAGDATWEETREITKKFLLKYPDKKWVIDAGSLQTLDTAWIPKGAILTPNQKEYKMIFNDMEIEEVAKKFNCLVVLKGPETIVCSPEKCVRVTGGNPGLTKGGTGDVQAGLTVALLAKNDPFLAASAAAYLIKFAADKIYQNVGTVYNSDDLANKIPEIINNKLNV